MILEVLTSALQKKFDNDERSGVHVSDLVLCPRKAILRKLEPNPTTMLELNFFTSGRAIHDAIQILAASEGDRFEIEKEVFYEGIVAHIDLFDKKNNIPIECKSMRTKAVKEPKPHHVEQLKCYMAMTGATKGIILYQLLMHFDNEPFAEFVVEMTEKQIQEQLVKMKSTAENFRVNLEQKTPMEAIGVLQNKDLNWLCNSCPYVQRCRDQRDGVKVE